MLTTAAFVAKQHELRKHLIHLRSAPRDVLAAGAHDYFSKHMPGTELERDALWWTCVLERDMDSFYGAFEEKYKTIEGWRDDVHDESDADADADLDAPSTAILLSPNYGFLATRMRGVHRNADAQWHEDRYRAIHEYLCAAQLLPAPLHDDPANHFTSTLMQALMNKNLRLDATLNNSSTDKVCRALGELKGNNVIFLAMCGHGAMAAPSGGESGTLLLAGGDRLAERNIARALRDFKGTLILAYCMCHAGAAEPVATSDFAAPFTTESTDRDLQELGKSCNAIVRIYSTTRGDSLFPAQARTFTRLLERMIRETPAYEALATWVQDVWPSCRPLAQLPSHWRPAPVVTCSPRCTGRFLTKACSTPQM